MDKYLQVLSIIIIGIILLWFGYQLFFGHRAKMKKTADSRRRKRYPPKLTPGDPGACPVCSTKLEQGELVKTLAFPSPNGGKDRLMHIKGCLYCIGGELERYCPVCKAPLAVTGILVARIFERAGHRAHVHVLGCNHCRRRGVL